MKRSRGPIDIFNIYLVDKYNSYPFLQVRAFSKMFIFIGTCDVLYIAWASVTECSIYSVSWFAEGPLYIYTDTKKEINTKHNNYL